MNSIENNCNQPLETEDKLIMEGIGAQEIISYADPDIGEKKIGSSFFRGSRKNFNPYAKDFHKPNFLKDFLIEGWTPAKRLINHQTFITAFGSCFAENITRHLRSIGYNLSKDRNPDIYISSMGEGLVNIHAIAQQFEWALENMTPPVALWHGFKAEEFGYDEQIKLSTRDALLSTDFFIITLGLSEIWYDEVTGGIFWRAVPQINYDETRHKFRVCTVQETKNLLNRIHFLIRKHVPKAKVLFTLSPIPLAITFRDVSCITANVTSKAILRSALDEFYREHQNEINTDLFYFPSYEIISELFPAKYSSDGRHPNQEIIDVIMQLFESVYCDSDKTPEAIEILYKQARILSAERALAAALSP